MSKKKYAVLILILAIISAVITACSSSPETADKPMAGEPAGETAGNEIMPETTENLSEPELPDADFEGYRFRIINTMDSEITWLMKTLVVEEEDGDALNDAIYKRNRILEEKYGFNLEQIDASGPDDAAAKAKKSIQAGEDAFDLAMTTPGQALQMAQAGQLEKIDEIPNIDLSKPYWDQDMNRDFSIANRLFFTSGDFSFNQYSATVPIFFNKKLLADLGLENPYKLVKEGRWTIDKFGEMGKAGLKDLNGDGLYNKGDQWGYMAFSHVYTLGIMNGLGMRYVMKDENDIPYATVNTEYFINAFYTAFDILQDGWLYDGNTRGDGRPEDMFLESRALFWTELMNWANILRSMENDFGILPMPKLNEQQEIYISSTGMPHVMCIPVTTSDLSRTGTILEALCAESMKSTKPAYYDTMLKNKVMSRDEESGEMLDIIFANKIYEVGRMYWESTIAGPIASLMANGNRDIASIIERNESRAANDIAKAVDAFMGD